MEVFLVVVLLHPTKKQRDEESLSAEILAGPVAVMAKNEQQVALQVASLIPEKHRQVPPDRLEVLAIPFRRVNRENNR